MKVTILGTELDVDLVDGMADDCHGFCKPEWRQIMIRSELPEDEVQAIMYHELGHYLWYRLVNGDTITEEKFCQIMESMATFFIIQEENAPLGLDN
jgi:hypothetical protein